MDQNEPEEEVCYLLFQLEFIMKSRQSSSLASVLDAVLSLTGIRSVDSVPSGWTHHLNIAESYFVYMDYVCHNDVFFSFFFYFCILPLCHNKKPYYNHVF